MVTIYRIIPCKHKGQIWYKSQKLVKLLWLTKWVDITGILWVDKFFCESEISCHNPKNDSVLDMLLTS
jgi:hypothetical protein